MQQELAKAGDLVSKKYFTNILVEQQRGSRVWQLMRDAQLQCIKDICSKGFDKTVKVADPINGKNFLIEILHYHALCIDLLSLLILIIVFCSL